MKITKPLATLLMLASFSMVGCEAPQDPLNGPSPVASESPVIHDDVDTVHAVNKPVLAQDSVRPDANIDAKAPQNAIAILRPVGDSGVSGTVYFQRDGEALHIWGEVKGLEPGKHGFHVHEYGDLSDEATGKSAGGHYNPANSDHGHREDEVRHAGDYGNIEANAQGVAKFDFTDRISSLEGDTSILGRGMVVHKGEDKFTQPTGDAGDRVAFGVIGVAAADSAKK